MIKEAYCSYEVSKLLKEKGFLKGVNLRIIPNLAFYDNISLHYNIAKWYDSLIQDRIDFVVAPTHQMAMKWLREEKHYYIQIMLDSWTLGGHTGYYVVIQRIDNDFEMMLQDAVNEVFYQNYEDAVEAALKYCLENLI